MIENGQNGEIGAYPIFRRGRRCIVLSHTEVHTYGLSLLCRNNGQGTIITSVPSTVHSHRKHASALILKNFLFASRYTCIGKEGLHERTGRQVLKVVVVEIQSLALRQNKSLGRIFQAVLCSKRF